LCKALAVINIKYEGNISFNNLQSINNKGDRVQFTLRVKDSHKSGARLGFMTTKDGGYNHLINACWHVHGDMFEAILAIRPEAIIHAGKRKIDINGGNWEDWNIGSQVQYRGYSEACNCE
jgi:hypothetical protein